MKLAGQVLYFHQVELFSVLSGCYRAHRSCVTAQLCVQRLHGTENTCSGGQRSIRPRSRPWGLPVGKVKDPHSQSGV